MAQTLTTRNYFLSAGESFIFNAVEDGDTMILTPVHSLADEKHNVLFFDAPEAGTLTITGREAVEAVRSLLQWNPKTI